MIKISKSNRTVRETTANYEDVDSEGKLQKTEIRVLYFGFTTNDLKQITAEQEKSKAEDPTFVPWKSDLLAKRIHSLPDLSDAKGKPFAITVENLDLLEVRNLRAIEDAIDDDLSGKSQPVTAPRG